MNSSSLFGLGKSPGKLEIAHNGPQHPLDIAKDSDSPTRPIPACLDLSRAISAEIEFSKSAWCPVVSLLPIFAPFCALLRQTFWPPRRSRSACSRSLTLTNAY